MDTLDLFASVPAGAPVSTGTPSPDRPFRVEAGPGAGKTRWLTEHVAHTLACGERLGDRARVACITYTQIGTETLQSRLRGHLDHVWISTIHSFLYHHIVRPYAYKLGIEGLDTAALAGHEPLRPRASHAMAWLDDLGLNPKNWHAMPGLATTLSRNLEHNLEWLLLDGIWSLGFSKGSNWQGLSYPSQSPKNFYGNPEKLLSYKRRYWQEGRIDHDDVVYLSHRLLTEHEGLASALARRFPYMYLDEYQDTTPLQSDIVQMLADAGATVGVIGDIAQSIFSFTGAGPNHYVRFNPPGCIQHTLDGNWRSTQPIVEILNRYRRDGLRQTSRREIEPGHAPSQPRVLIGSLADAYAAACGRIGGQGILHLVARNHIEVAELMRVAAGRSGIATPWTDLFNANADRAEFFRTLCRAARRARNSRPQEAMRELAGLFRGGGHPAKPLQGNALSPLGRRALGVSLLLEFERLLETAGTSTLDAYRSLGVFVDHSVPDMRLSAAKDGTAFATAAAVPLVDLFDTVELDVPTGLIRTIHGFKGDQADSVFLYVTKGAFLRRLYLPDDHEDTRLIYVALSRAENHLFVCIPGCDPILDSAFAAMGYVVERLPSALNDLPSSADSGVGVAASLSRRRAPTRRRGS